MALVTIQRSPSPSTDPDLDAADSSEDVSDGRSQIRKRSKTSKEKLRKIFSTVRFISKLRPCLSESYFTVKGAALILPHNECTKKSSKKSHGGEIQSHLQAMLHLLRPEDTIKIAVRLEDICASSQRYMALVSTRGRQDTEEAVILGIDCTSTEASIGLVLPVWMGLKIKLGGDGGFSLCTDEHSYLFKPVSVQAMWSAIQSLVKALHTAEDMKYIPEGLTHTWIGYYRSRIDRRDAARMGLWNVEGVEVFAPSSLSIKSDNENEKIKLAISQKLKEVMMTVDLDEATSIMLRREVEAKLDMSLTEFKSYFDEEVMRILGQMDEPSKILDFLYLGSEWNASNLEELKGKGIGYILNVTKEIDNFFMGMFQYYNVRVYDVEESELLKHWDKTYKFITKARDHNSKVLVHCKMGVSRSASTVMAFLMKDRRWTVDQAYQFVKERRSCVHPNSGFMEQLHMYEGILTASNQREIFRHKSEQNLLEEGSREDTDLSQGSFLGDSLFHMMSHSNWPSASEGVTREEEWINSLNTDQMPGTDMLQMDTDLETAESRSADSMEEALPDIPSPPPPPDSTESATSLLSSRQYFSGQSGDVEMSHSQERDLSSESESCSAMCLSEGNEKFTSLSMPAVSGLSSRIRPDSSWIRLDSLDTSLEKEDSQTENLPFIDALPADDLCNNTQTSSSSNFGATAAAENPGAAMAQVEPSHPSANTTDTEREYVPNISVPASLPYSSVCCSQAGAISPDTPASGHGEGIEFYIGQKQLPFESKASVPLICVNSEMPQGSFPLMNPSTMNQPSGDHRSTVALSHPSPGTLENTAREALANSSSLEEQIPHQIIITAPQDEEEEKGTIELVKTEGEDSATPVTKSPKGRIEHGVRQYFFREKIPWKPGKVKKIQEGINKTGQIATDEDTEDEAHVGERQRLGMQQADQDLQDDRTLLDQICDPHPATALSQSRSCMELFSPEGEGSATSCYEREEIPMEPGTVLRTKLEIEERQRLFCGDGDREIFGSVRPVIRTSSLKQERDTPRSRYADNRRLTCGPIMSPLSGKSWDDLRSAGASAVDLSDMRSQPQSHSEMKDSGDIIETAGSCDNEGPAQQVQEEKTPIEAGIVRKQKLELENKYESDRPLSRPTNTSDSLTALLPMSIGISPPPAPPPSPSSSQMLDSQQRCRQNDRTAVGDCTSSQHDMPLLSSPWKQERTRGNFDSETLALIREIGSALLMSPTPPKPKDADDDEPCTNMVRYFVRKIEKQTETLKKPRDIILIDSDTNKTSQPSKEDAAKRKVSVPGAEAVTESASCASQPVTLSSEATKPVDIYPSLTQHRRGQSLDLNIENRYGQSGIRQEPPYLLGPVRSSVKTSDMGSHHDWGMGMTVNHACMGMQAISPTQESKHNMVPASLALSRTAEPAGAAAGFGAGGASAASSPRSRSQSGTCDSPDTSVVRHLVDRFEIRSPETERASSEFGHDYTYRARDHRDSSLSGSPSLCHRVQPKEDSWPASSPIYETSHPSGSSSSQSFFTPISTSSQPQSSFAVASTDSSAYPWMSPSAYSSSASSSPLLSLHRKHTSLDSAQAQPTIPKKSPLAFDIAVELFELPSPTSLAISNTSKKAGTASAACSTAISKPGPTPFSKSSMESVESKTWRSVRPKSADHVQRSASSSDYDSESSSSDFHRVRKTGSRYDSSMAGDDEISFRQVSDEGRKIRRLTGKSHPLTKLSQQRKGPFYSSM